jgi:hypothetical protein
MVAPDRTKAAEESPKSQETLASKSSTEQERVGPRGFGEFSGAYRARWALSHPDMCRQWPADRNPPSALATGGEATHIARPPVTKTPDSDTPASDTPRVVPNEGPRE